MLMLKSSTTLHMRGYLNPARILKASACGHQPTRMTILFQDKDTIRSPQKPSESDKLSATETLDSGSSRLSPGT